MTKKRLGRGMSALLRDLENTKDGPVPEAKNGFSNFPLKDLHPSRFQPRRDFSDVEIQELAASIKKSGILQPLLIRKSEDGKGEIIAGERRFRAAKQAGLSEVPVIIKDITDKEALILAFVENVQREDLSPLEEAEGLEALLKETGGSQEDVAAMVGKSRSYVANALRLNTLPEEIKTFLKNKQISAGIARTLVGHPDAAELAKIAIVKNMNVRQVEHLAKTMRQESKDRKPRKVAEVLHSEEQDRLAAERAIASALDMNVQISFGSKRKTLTIHFETMEELDRIMNAISAARHSVD